GVQCPYPDQIAHGRPLYGKLAYGQACAAQGNGRNDGVDPGAVSQPCVNHRRALVNSAAQWRYDAFYYPQNSLLAAEARRMAEQAAAHLDKYFIMPIDHDLRNRCVGQ